jgi:hypothetical protein
MCESRKNDGICVIDLYTKKWGMVEYPMYIAFYIYT